MDHLRILASLIPSLLCERFYVGSRKSSMVSLFRHGAFFSSVFFLSFVFPATAPPKRSTDGPIR